MIITSLLLFILLLTGCYEGYVSSTEAEMLTQYLEPEALRTLTMNPDESIRIIDVRPRTAYDNGHIPTAESYPSGVILEKLDELPIVQFYIVYCETGGRAQGVIKKLEEKGYTKMMNWGGYTRWPYEFEK